MHPFCSPTAVQNVSQALNIIRFHCHSFTLQIFRKIQSDILFSLPGGTDCHRWMDEDASFYRFSGKLTFIPRPASELMYKIRLKDLNSKTKPTIQGTCSIKKRFLLITADNLTLRMKNTFCFVELNDMIELQIIFEEKYYHPFWNLDTRTKIAVANEPF